MTEEKTESEHKKRTRLRKEAIEERNSARRQVLAIYDPQIQKLKLEKEQALREVDKNWREQMGRANGNG